MTWRQQMDVDDPVEEMTPDECWKLLESEQFGRLAFRLVDEVHVVPADREVHRLEALAGLPWVPTEKLEAIELVPEAVSGRRFFLQRS